MKKMSLTLVAVSALAGLSACGGGGDAAGSSSEIALENPTHIDAQQARITKFVYFVPKGTPVKERYTRSIKRGAKAIQSWYATQLDGNSIRLTNNIVHTCRGSMPRSYYATQSWSRVFAAIQQCFADFGWDDPNHRWVVYADVRHQCGDPERLGAGTNGVTILPVQDLQGLAGESNIVDDCGTPIPYTGLGWVNRWIGGLGHELGHALGLPHPPGCDEGLASCDYGALMWAGYVSFPDTWFRPEEKTFLQSSPFIGPLKTRHHASSAEFPSNSDDGL